MHEQGGETGRHQSDPLDVDVITNELLATTFMSLAAAGLLTIIVLVSLRCDYRGPLVVQRSHTK